MFEPRLATCLDCGRQWEIVPTWWKMDIDGEMRLLCCRACGSYSVHYDSTQLEDSISAALETVKYWRQKGIEYDEDRLRAQLDLKAMWRECMGMPGPRVHHAGYCPVAPDGVIVQTGYDLAIKPDGAYPTWEEVAAWDHPKFLAKMLDEHGRPDDAAKVRKAYAYLDRYRVFPSCVMVL